MHVIFGATGALGRRVATRLLKAGEPVRVVSRDRRRLGALVRAGAQGATADLLEPDTLAAPLAGAGTLIVAAHGLVPPSRRNHPGAVDGRGVRALVDQAAGAGVGRIVYLSVAGAGEGATAFARIKAAGERHLAGCGVPHTIQRPSIFMENHPPLPAGSLDRVGEVRLAQVVAAWVEGQVVEPPHTSPDVQAPDRPRS
jgi:NAD(P)H dehydrogenase (quinone)